MRSRQWLVESVEEPGGSPVVSLACADDDAQGQALEVFWDCELDRRILHDEGWNALGERGFDDPRRFAGFFHTLRWNCVTATDPRLIQSPFRAGIRLDAYQMEPLRKALRLPRLVRQARSIEDHLEHARKTGALCSNDPVCAQHLPGTDDMEDRPLHGAACHGCALVAETSCEMRNDYLDRALVVPVLGHPDAAFFGRVSG